MNEKGVTLIELIVTIAIIGILGAISFTSANLRSNKLKVFGEEFVTDFNLYRSLTAETPGKYRIDFTSGGYSVSRQNYGKENKVIANRYLPRGLEWTKKPRGMVFGNDNKLQIAGEKAVMTIEVVDRDRKTKMEITVVPVSNRVTIARYTEL